MPVRGYKTCETMFLRTAVQFVMNVLVRPFPDSVLLSTTVHASLTKSAQTYEVT